MPRPHLSKSLRCLLDAFQPCFTFATFATFVVAALVVELPFLQRPIALSVLFRLWQPGGPSKPALAFQLVTLIARARPDRRVHVVADGAYLCRTLRHLPDSVTLTGPPPRHAGLYEAHPDTAQARPLRRRGRPRVRGERIGTPAELAAATPGVPTTVTRYGRTSTVTVHERRCLWYGVFRSQPIRVLAVREPRKPGFALVTTDLTTPAARIIECYAARWAIEVALADAKHITGAGEARNRTRRAVERTAPFVMLAQSLVVVWYHLAGHSPKVVADHRHRARWYTTKPP
ncbi:hypothetical protein GCM10010174_38640 [Kutzneria viridogrisea]|uniref:Transposase IS4-like domain-containing protein n=1 Tax=Kutzneria viridogrisea TaxID=47990 RepID=A0ABR6BYE7_9PSEU|nr:hypothetical protein [Kutzneria viridogrisea]